MLRGGSQVRSKALGSEPSLIGVRGFESLPPHLSPSFKLRFYLAFSRSTPSKNPIEHFLFDCGEHLFGPDFCSSLAINAN